MHKLIMVFGCFLVFGCVSENVEEPLDISAEELKAGAYSGGSGLVFGNNPYGDCLTDCSHEKAACERSNGDRGHDDLMTPCDLAYSFCKADCRDAFPQ